MEKKVSNCCGWQDTAMSGDGPNFSEMGICPKCKDYCEFQTEEEYENEMIEDRKFTKEQEKIIEGIKNEN